MHTAVLTLFRTHTNEFGGNYYLQQHGGPIGLRSTCCIARIVMLWWDKQLAEVMARSNLTSEERARYMDDIRIWMMNIRLGWRWQDGDLVYISQWRQEKKDRGMSGLQKTI